MREVSRASPPGAETTEDTNADAQPAGPFAPEQLERMAAELEAELRLPKPNAILLLDSGYGLFAKGDPAQKALATRALYGLDLSDRALTDYRRELFYFTHAVAQAAPAGILEHIDRFCLANEEEFTLPRHVTNLDPSLQCVFLYGVVGPAAEEHLVELARRDTKHRLRVLEILNWLGTETSVDAVLALLRAEPNADMIARATGYFMRVGGPRGRDALLSLDPAQLSPEVRELYLRLRPQIEQITESTLVEPVREGAPPASIEDDAVVCQGLQLMYESDGKNQATSPMDLLDSGLPPSFLIPQLVAIRQRTLRRLSQHALADVQVTNVLINILQYRHAR